MSRTVGQLASVFVSSSVIPNNQSSFLFLKLPPPPRAVLLELYIWMTKIRNQQATSSKKCYRNVADTSSLSGRQIHLSTWQNLAGLRCWAWRSFTKWRWRRCQCSWNLGCLFVYSSGCCASVRVEFCWDFWADENDRLPLQKLGIDDFFVAVWKGP